jgi:hypothetical protein
MAGFLNFLPAWGMCFWKSPKAHIHPLPGARTMTINLELLFLMPIYIRVFGKVDRREEDRAVSFPTRDCGNMPEFRSGGLFLVNFSLFLIYF